MDSGRTVNVEEGETFYNFFLTDTRPSSSSGTYVSSKTGNPEINSSSKIQLNIHPHCPIGCYPRTDGVSEEVEQNQTQTGKEMNGLVTVNKDIAGETAKSEVKAVKNRILLCWLTLTIPLFLYLKFKFWDTITTG